MVTKSRVAPASQRGARAHATRSWRARARNTSARVSRERAPAALRRSAPNAQVQPWCSAGNQSIGATAAVRHAQRVRARRGAGAGATVKSTAARHALVPKRASGGARGAATPRAGWRVARRAPCTGQTTSDAFQRVEKDRRASISAANRVMRAPMSRRAEPRARDEGQGAVEQQGLRPGQEPDRGAPRREDRDLEHRAARARPRPRPTARPGPPRAVGLESSSRTHEARSAQTPGRPRRARSQERHDRASHGSPRVRPREAPAAPERAVHEREHPDVDRPARAAPRRAAPAPRARPASDGHESKLDACRARQEDDEHRTEGWPGRRTPCPLRGVARRRSPISRATWNTNASAITRPRELAGDRKRIAMPDEPSPR